MSLRMCPATQILMTTLPSIPSRLLMAPWKCTVRSRDHRNISLLQCPLSRVGPIMTPRCRFHIDLGLIDASGVIDGGDGTFEPECGATFMPGA